MTENALTYQQTVNAKVVARLVEAERRLAIAREALERIARLPLSTESAFGVIAREALAALNGEGE